MDAESPLESADLARDQLSADLDVIEAALARIRATPTGLVGNAFRIGMAERFEHQIRLVNGLCYRTIGEIVDPPDGFEDRDPRPGRRVRQRLARSLRITPSEVRRRVKIATRISPRRSMTGPALPPDLAALSDAVAAGDVGEEHLREVCKALDALPNHVAAADRDRAERVLVDHARKQDSAFVAAVGRRIADVLNPDGVFDDRDRANRRSLTLGAQGQDGMSRLSGWLTPEARSYLEAVSAAVRPGRHHPDAGRPVVDGGTDRRTPAQRLHDAFALALRAGIGSGELGMHRGIPVTVIATTTVENLEQATRAIDDPSVPMPPPARTGGGSNLPMRDLIAMASESIHYLLVFEGHSERPLYLGRSRRLASADLRMVCHGRDHGCTRPGCTAAGYDCEVHHAPAWHQDGRSDADKVYFGCHDDNAAAEDDEVSTTVTEQGRLAWSDGTGPPEVNRLHHPEELFPGDEYVGDECSSEDRWVTSGTRPVSEPVAESPRRQGVSPTPPDPDFRGTAPS